MRRTLALALLLAGCSDGVCGGVSGTCIDLKVTGTTDVDQLIVSLALGTVSASMLAPTTPTHTSLPVHVALHVSESSASGIGTIGVSGLLGGSIVGRGATAITVHDGEHASATVDISGGGSDGGSDGGGPIFTPVSFVARNKVDLLFMVDNSPSMSPKQAELKARFPALIQILDAFGKTSPADYHIGVVTSDLGAGQFNLGGGQCHPGGDGGKLQALGAAHDATCLPPTGGLNFVDYDQITGSNNLPAGQDLATTFACMASVGDKGCGFEQQLESVYRALHDQPAENHDFLRADALLVVVWITDEDDDCSADPNTDLFDPAQTANYGALLSYRGTEFGVACPQGGNLLLMPYGSSGGNLQPGCVPAPNPTGNVVGLPPPGQGKCYDVRRYINYFTKPAGQGGIKVDPSSVSLVAIAAPTDDVESLLANPNPQPPGPYQSCPGPVDGKTCAVALQHGCISPQNTQFFGDPAVRISAVVNSAQNKQLTSICDASYQTALQGLGQLVVSQVGPPGCLPHAPDNPSTPNCQVEDVTTNPDGSTTLTPISGCSAGGLPCWTVVSSTVCASGYQLQIQRNGQPPPNTTQQAACVLQL